MCQPVRYDEPPRARPEPRAGRRMDPALLFGLALMTLGVLGGAFARARIAETERTRRYEVERNESAAVRLLMNVHEAQRRFVLEDLDRNGVRDYALSLDVLQSTGALELMRSGRLDPPLEPGTVRLDRWGYRLELQVAADRLAYIAIAGPLRQGHTGERYFAVNEQRMVSERTDRYEELPYVCCSYGPIVLDSSLRMPDADACDCVPGLRRLHPYLSQAR